MVIQEQIKIGDKTFIKSYSDRFLYIESSGIYFDEAIDLPEFNHNTPRRRSASTATKS